MNKNIINNIISKIVISIFVSSFCINMNLYAASIATIGLDSSLMTTYLAEDESTNAEILTAVNNFIANYITINMSDFEKEMQIIKYLVATVKYDVEEIGSESNYISDSYKAYGALVNGKAVCSGYAKAFDLIAKRCGLSTNVVTGEAINSNNQNGPHAWNQIYLDGEWYNVDVTFEDPITNIEVGFNQLFNNYINRTDFEFSKNHIRENGHDCTATKYGKNFVAYYLNTGIMDFSASIDNLRKEYEGQIGIYSANNDDASINEVVNKLFMIGTKYDDNSNFFSLNSDIDITNYILAKIESGEKVITIVTPTNSQNLFSIDSGDWLKNNIKIYGKSSMRKVFLSDGEYDTRILIFSFIYM